MKKIALACVLASAGFACATPNAGMMPMQPAPSHPVPLASTCACGGDKQAPDHATGCPCAGHQSEHGENHTCGCGTGAESAPEHAEGSASSAD